MRAVWPDGRSGLGELLNFDYQTLSLMQMYRASDALMKHRQAVEAHLFTRAMGLFDLQPTVTLFDLTNTFRRGGQPSTQGPAGSLEGQAQRLSAADAGIGAGRGGVCAPLRGLCRPGRGTGDVVELPEKLCSHRVLEEVVRRSDIDSPPGKPLQHLHRTGLQTRQSNFCKIRSRA